MGLRSAVELLPRWTNFRLAYMGLTKPKRPINLTFSITNACNSKCQSCDIYMVYRKMPKLFRSELTLDEIEKTFASIGKVFFFNISGGEPFLRKDIADIIELAVKHLKPRVIHIPTNAISPKLIEKRLTDALERIDRLAPGTPITLKPSLDGVGKLHDEVRGVPGNFKLVEETLAVLRKLQWKYPNLKVGLGTVISTLNIHGMEDLFDYVEEVQPDSYISEIAEERTEMFNIGRGITPDAETYKGAINTFKRRMPRFMKGSSGLSRMTMAFRLLYYDLVVKTLRERKQVIPCYGGISNVHISPYGDIWPCCVLGYEKSFGNVRSSKYDFWKVWWSQRAKEVRKYIKDGKCACPLANQYYANILMHLRSMVRVGLRYVFPKAFVPKDEPSTAPIRTTELPGVLASAGRRHKPDAPLTVETGGALVEPVAAAVSKNARQRADASAAAGAAAATSGDPGSDVPTAKQESTPAVESEQEA